ncbi:MAG TPA: AraC family transcriptional regulator [Candidatus Sulfotelmatobacter sp.]|jgi:AraC-like DNA-binding protein|nr:AraC family transcriptional regulator [Candidatus Sulfotelmatobacter sp.]
MKPVFEKTPRTQRESLHCEVVRGDSYNATWHFHPEYQITLVLESSGHRLVGDNITPLQPGDLVLVGAKLPHVWQQDEVRPARKTGAKPAVHAIIVRFLETFAGGDFLEIPEMAPVRRLLRQAARGLQVTGRTRDLAAEKMQLLAEAEGLERVSGLLSLLSLLAQSDELKPVSSPGFTPELDGADQDRMQRVCHHINTHLAGRVERGQVAREAHLSEGTFSRFFKLRTGKTLPRYVNELRAGRACQLLAAENGKVTDIAFACGFTNLANFNRQFRKITGLSPREYRRQFRVRA